MSLFVSRVSFCYCLIDMSVFAVFLEVVNLLCKLPCGFMVQRPSDTFHRIIETGLIYFGSLNPIPAGGMASWVWGKWEMRTHLKQLADRNFERLFKSVSKWFSLSDINEPFFKRKTKCYLPNYIAIRLDKFYFVHCAKVLFRLRQKKALVCLLSLVPTRWWWEDVRDAQRETRTITYPS